MQRLTELIIKTAIADIGIKEKPNNSGWYNSIKEKALKAAGWIMGQPWCSYEAETIWVDAFNVEDPNAVGLLRKYFSGSAVQTWKNFRASKEFKTSPNIPYLGSLAVWQHYKNGTATGQGHIGVVVEAPNANMFKSIEGNTSEAGSREGTVVGKNSHVIDKERARENGLRLLGFISAIRIA